MQNSGPLHSVGQRPETWQTPAFISGPAQCLSKWSICCQLHYRERDPLQDASMKKVNTKKCGQNLNQHDQLEDKNLFSRTWLFYITASLRMVLSKDVLL